MNRFEGKNVLITGTSKGIGKALAEYFAVEGAEVYAVSRSEAKFEQSNIHFIKADISESERILSILEDEDVTIDILINNAGIICYRSLMEVSKEEIEDVFGTNVISTLLLSRQICGKMIEKNIPGVIVNTLSFAANIPSAGSGIYASSKAALTSLTRTMAAEWAPYGIRVNGYSPGVIETDMTKPAIAQNHDSMVDAIALHEIGNTSQVVKVVGFLASEDSSYMTGVNLDVSGGKFIVQNAGQAWKKKD